MQNFIWTFTWILSFFVNPFVQCSYKNVERSETTWNNLQLARNDLKKSTTKWNVLQGPRNNLKRSSTARNDLHWARNHLKQPKIISNDLRQDYFIIWSNPFFSLTPFFTQCLITIIKGLLHGESWWKYSSKHFYIFTCIHYRIQNLHNMMQTTWHL